MYTAYFGFHERPFNVTPDPRFFYSNPTYQEAYAALLYGIRERKGFIVLTGEVGTGKTTLLRRLMNNLNSTVRFAFFYNTTLSFGELLSFICEELDLRVKRGGRLRKIQVLNEFLIAQLRKGGTGALLIDEAQNLGEEVLENLRLLSNLETANEKLLQIVLVGQPELENKLDRPELRQLKQRVAVQCRLDHLRDREVGPFIDYRLHAVGYERNDLFAPDAIRQIALYSRGIPRLINIICDNALLIAYAASHKKVSADIIGEVAHDLRLGSEVQAFRAQAPTATTASKNGKEEGLHPLAHEAPQRKSMHLAGVKDGPPRGQPPTEVKPMSQERERILQVTPTERTVFRIADLGQERNGPVTIPSAGLRVLSKIDGFRDVQAIAESLGLSCASTAEVIETLQHSGLVEVVSSPTKARPDTVSALFFDVLTGALTEAMGPMASVSLHDQIVALGESPQAFPEGRLKELVESVSREILNGRLRIRFQQRMSEEIHALDTPLPTLARR